MAASKVLVAAVAPIKNGAALPNIDRLFPADCELKALLVTPFLINDAEDRNWEAKRDGRAILMVFFTGRITINVNDVESGWKRTQTSDIGH